MFKMKCIRWYFYIDSSDADNGFYYSEYITGGEGDDWQTVQLTIPRSVD
jgi:hypothetical protein